MMWLLSTEELRHLHGRLVFIALTGKLSPRAKVTAAEIAAELWLRTGAQPSEIHLDK